VTTLVSSCIIEIVEYQESVPYKKKSSIISKTWQLPMAPCRLDAPADGSAPGVMFVGICMKCIRRPQDRDVKSGSPQPNQDGVDISRLLSSSHGVSNVFNKMRIILTGMNSNGFQKFWIEYLEML
jgi:hypothetical protein